MNQVNAGQVMNAESGSGKTDGAGRSLNGKKPTNPIGYVDR
jgi:hypothetical protein